MKLDSNCFIPACIWLHEYATSGAKKVPVLWQQDVDDFTTIQFCTKSMISSPIIVFLGADEG